MRACSSGSAIFSRHIWWATVRGGWQDSAVVAPGNAAGDPWGIMLFALAIKPLILRVQSECDLELNLWYADDGTLVGSIAEVAKVYQILKDDGPKYSFSLVPHKTSLWWWTMDCVRLRLLFDCRLDIDDSDIPLPGIVLVGSPVGSDDFVKQHPISKSTKVDVVLGMIADVRNSMCRRFLPTYDLTAVHSHRRRSDLYATDRVAQRR
jgi:hypothetical protein